MAKQPTLRVIGTSLLIWSGTVFAGQSELDFFDLSLEELLQVEVDVASKFSETQLEAAASVSHLDAQEWQAFGAVRNSDALSILPGVMIYPVTGDAIAIRGYGQILSRRGIATLIDGVSVNDFTFGSSQVSMEHVSLGVLDSMDVIRGPGSVLYGTDAFHGVVSLNTYYRESEDDQTRFSIGSDGEQRASWQFSETFADGHFVNLAIDKLNQDDARREHWYYGTNGKYALGVPLVKSHRDEDTDVGSALLKLHNRRDDDLFYQVSILHNQTEFSGFPGGGAVLGFVTEDTVGNRSRNQLYRLELEQLLNKNWKLGAYSFYTDLDRHIQFQTSSLIGNTHNDIHKHGAQIYAKYLSDDETFRFFTGVEYTYQSIDESYTKRYAADGRVLAQLPGADNGLSRRVNSFLFQARKEFPQFETELGVRLDEYSDFGQHTTPRLAFIKTLPDQQILKILYSQAFRAAVSAELKGSSFVRGDANIAPETIDTYELVYSRQYQDIFVTATLFKSQWKDGITVAPLDPAEQPPFTSEYVNLAESNSRGAELALSYVEGRWHLTTDLTYTRSKDEFRNIDYAAFPQYIWNSRVAYSFDSSTQLHLTQRVHHDMTSGHNNYSSTGDDLNRPLPCYWVFDVGLVKTFTPSLTGEIVLKNLFDRENWSPSVYNTPNGIRDNSFSALATLTLSF